MGPGEWTDIRGKLDFAKSGKPMLVGMAVILALVAGTAGFVLSGPATTSEYVSKETIGSETSAGSVQEPDMLFVHVSGAIVNPGLYELESGSRVADAVQAAGGFTEDADSNSCNLARIVEDGEHLVIATIGGGQDQNGEEQGGNSSVVAGQGLLNINTASAEQLESLPGIGESTARRIVADRTLNGPFKTVGDLTRVSGIGEKKLAAIADYICV